jgi:hypothetical protein
VLQITLSATDPDEEPLTYSFKGNLPGEPVIDEITGVFRWVPPDGSNGRYEVTFICRDGDEAEDSEAITITVYIEREIKLYAGWNLISLPLKPLIPYTASSLAAEINEQGGSCRKAQEWRLGGWGTYDLAIHEDTGHPLGNFDVVEGKGYFLLCDDRSTFTLKGMQVEEIIIPLYPGFNLFGLQERVVSVVGLASDVGRSVEQQGGAPTLMQKWVAGMWNTHIFDLPFGDFKIEPGEGYFIYCKEKCDWRLVVGKEDGK